MNDMRANPDDILRKINEETKAQAQMRGHLKLFFGYAAGVGKTFAMLKAAHAAKRRGVDVVIGYIEPHTRPQTTALMNGLEKLPALSVPYKNISLQEFDLDAAIRRRPKLILVDELAHTNAEGCRHAKRYQDIEELLKCGIDVYSTVNVQHIESLNDMVASVTGVIVRERIPDHVFDNADQVELLDVEPEELIERLNTGKIYGDVQAQKALGNFFVKENLVSLRELALRRCADRVNKLAERAKLVPNGHYSDEHVLVCLSSSPSNPKIIRTAARMAAAFKGSFTALFVESPDFDVMSDENKKRLRGNIRIAEQLGATIETVYGDDIAVQISEFARISGVSKIVVGRSNAKKRSLFGTPTLVEQLTENAPALEIYIIPDKLATVPYKGKKARSLPKTAEFFKNLIRSLCVLAAATLVGFGFYEAGFSEANIITVYIFGVLATAVITTQQMFSMVSSVVSVLTFNFFFTVPRFTLNAYDSGYPATFLIMFFSAFLTSSLAVRIKRHAKQAARSAFRTRVLLETNQLLQREKEQGGIGAVTAHQLVKLLHRDVALYLSENEELSAPTIYYSDSAEHPLADYTGENEKAVAAWVFKNNKRAGASTATLSNAKCLYMAIRVNDTVYGVVGIAISADPLSPAESNIVLSILGECAISLENNFVSKQREEAAAHAKNEQLRADLLRAISHDFRTPLTSISGNAGILLASGDAIDDEKKQKLYSNIYDDSLWLINLVENLLSVTRIENGTMKLNMTAELMDEVIDEALSHINNRKQEHTITVRRSEEMILAEMDARLIVQVIINLVDNAIKYTPPNTEICIDTRKVGDTVFVEVLDKGKGISDEAKPKIFDMFYTAGTKIADSRRSLGLGLSLCKAIITAHGGEISVHDNKPSGAVFRFTLRAKEIAIYE
ncbi:MAG: sensor histidine kinase KdpD [Oscillospiraceae bacterium]